MIQSSLSWLRQLLQDCRSFCRDIEWRKTNVGYYVEYWRICEILWYLTIILEVDAHWYITWTIVFFNIEKDGNSSKTSGLSRLNKNNLFEKSLLDIQTNVSIHFLTSLGTTSGTNNLFKKLFSKKLAGGVSLLWISFFKILSDINK